ncbi:SDR family oxidoreductase [Campylobacter sp. RM9756]|nr:SDR family oxidoreductase [Campylobacter sp. RM9756]
MFKDDLFKGKSFLITGASSGMGAHVALTLNELGAKIVAIARNEKKLQEQKNQAKNPENFICISKDLSDYEKLDSWTLELCKEFGGFDGAVLGAGISLASSIRTPNYIQQAQKMFNINYFGNLQVLKGMVDRRAHSRIGSSFIWIASITVINPPKGLSLYSGSKAAAIATIKSIATEIIPQFRINSISPGGVDTPMLSDTGRRSGRNYIDISNANHPLGVAKPKDITPLICFLLSEGSSWITGQDFMLDGGKLG